VTRSRENLLQEVDGAPVMEFLKDCALTRTHGVFDGAALNIAVFYQLPGESERQVTHVVLPSAGNALDHVRIQPELPAGTRIWLARRDPTSISEDIEALADGLARGLQGRAPRALLHFDCAGRGRVMFSQEQLVHNLNRLHQAIPAAPPWAGFYSYGELVPHSQGNGYNNYSAVLASLSDP
jgi:small ligand-binding sensory domain FIST